jgi:hypothetical protein
MVVGAAGRGAGGRSSASLRTSPRMRAVGAVLTSFVAVCGETPTCGRVIFRSNDRLLPPKPSCNRAGSFRGCHDAPLGLRP